MRISKLNRPFHYSDIQSYQQCPLSFYFQNTLNLKSKFVSWQSVIGRAMKSAIDSIHQDEKYFEHPEELKHLLQDYYEKACTNFLAQGVAVKEHINIPLAPYSQMLKGYVQKHENREAKIIYSRAHFIFAIKPFKTTYYFSGCIDQLRQNNDGSYELIVFNSGKKNGHKSFELQMNLQLSTYTYALYKGEICENHCRGEWQRPGIVPDFVSLYFLQDHLLYRRSCKKRDDYGDLIHCHPGDERGPALYRSTRSRERLAHIPRELGRICAAINRNIFFPRPNLYCQEYCAYRNYCQAVITFFLE
jgi:hypothetical protein